MPEILDGVVEIKNVAREPGHRTKIAVVSHDRNVDPVGACVGSKGARVRAVMNELRGEKIDIIKWTDKLEEFVANALSPAKVKEVRIQDEGQTAFVIVPDYQLSLAIGKEGQNARLAARLTGLRVDIKSESQVRREIEIREGILADAAAARESQEKTREARPAEVNQPAPGGTGEQPAEATTAAAQQRAETSEAPSQQAGRTGTA